MMNLPDFASMIDNLYSNDIEKQVESLDKTVDLMNTLAKKAINVLEKSSDPLFIAERLYKFGSIVVPYLRELFHKSDNSEVKILTSLMLLRFGDKIGIPVLFNAINDKDYGCLAANSLAEAKIAEAFDIIVSRLRSCKIEQVDLIVTFLCALEKLGGQLPADLINRFSSSDVPWQIHTKLDELRIVR